MARKNRNKLLVPEARQQLDELKAELMGTKNPEDAKIEVRIFTEIKIQLLQNVILNFVCCF